RRLLKNTRAELHGRFAEWVEGRVGEAVEHDETIGWHLEQAHQHLRELGPIDAQGRALGERAARYLAAAGRRALARDDLPLAARRRPTSCTPLPSRVSARSGRARRHSTAPSPPPGAGATGGARTRCWPVRRSPRSRDRARSHGPAAAASTSCACCASPRGRPPSRLWRSAARACSKRYAVAPRWRVG